MNASKDMNKVNSTVLKQLTCFLLSAFILLSLLTAVSCTSSVPQELTNSERLWKDQRLSNYDFTLQRDCFCPEDWRGPVNIRVRNGAAISITYASSGLAVTEGKFNDADTIDKLFTMLKDAYTGKGDFEQKADTVNVTYHAQMGYPTTFFIDVSQTIADEESTKLIKTQLFLRLNALIGLASLLTIPRYNTSNLLGVKN